MTFKPLYTLLLALNCLGIHCDASTWTDHKGRTMEAQFIKTTGDGPSTTIVFKKDNGMHYQFPLANLSKADQQKIADLNAINEQNDSAPAAPEVIPKTEFEQKITKDLVRLKGGRLRRADQDELTTKDFYAIYYSAHWCPPCRTFTPKLVDFYKKASKKHENFEIIFVSSDRSEDDMASYMKEAKMPWLGLDFDKKKKSKELTQFAGGGIPCLVLVDRNGKVLSDSYVNGKYVGPSKVMRDLEQQLNN